VKDFLAMPEKNRIEEAAARVIGLEAELESAGEAAIADDDVARARTVLHDWVESVVGVVASPGIGRVSLIHANGSETRIASATLPYLLTKPVTFGG
jgi:hypothetical protein